MHCHLERLMQAREILDGLIDKIDSSNDGYNDLITAKHLIQSEIDEINRKPHDGEDGDGSSGKKKKWLEGFLKKLLTSFAAKIILDQFFDDE